MDDLAKWMGLTKAVNYDGKEAYFKKQKNVLKFVCYCKQFDPRKNPLIFSDLMTMLIEQGHNIHYDMKPIRTSRYFNIEAVIGYRGKAYVGKGTNIAGAFTQALARVLVDHEIEVVL